MVDVLGTLEGNLGLGGLLLGNTAAELLVETLDLVELAGSGTLTTGLLLADLVGLGNKFLASLLGRVGLILVLVGQGNVDLGFDSVLSAESWLAKMTARSAGSEVCASCAHGNI